MIDFAPMGSLKTRGPVLAVALAATLVAPIGCGGDDDGAEGAAQSYVDARNDGDAARVCELYSDQFKQQIGAADNCAVFVEEQTSGSQGEFRLVRVEEDGDYATAVIGITPEGEAGQEPTAEQEVGVQLQQQDGDWLITSLVNED